ncbi:MAG: glycosyltransferase, partial [Bryobacteraceae bacterium]
MTKPDADSNARPPALVIAPEPPYPVAGGGALRSASLIEYLASRYTVDVVTFCEAGAPDPSAGFPPGRARRIHVLTLPRHSRAKVARIARNAARFARGVPPLIDRYAGLSRELAALLHGRRYALSLIEHFWCAPYADVVCGLSDSVVLDLHNVESVLQQRSGSAEPWGVAMAFQRFARAYRGLESRLLPRFDRILTASEEDARQVRQIYSPARVVVYPNTIPYVAAVS